MGLLILTKKALTCHNRLNERNGDFATVSRG
jgi:hypothetical protein